MENVQVKRGRAAIGGVAKNRRTLQETPDPMLEVIGFFVGEDLRGCLINFALHPTVLGAENLLYSADYPGYVRNIVSEHHPGCTTLMLNGAAGNINIGYSADASALGEAMNFRTFRKAEEVGCGIAQGALAALKEGWNMEKSLISVGSSEVRLPLKKLPCLGELAEEITSLQQVGSETDRAMDVKRIYLECLRDAIKKHELEGAMNS